jgi:hypothetical protein
MCGGDRQPDKELGPDIVLSLRRMDNEHIIQSAWDPNGDTAVVRCSTRHQ